jgi:ketosteroid isomerase-like protein
MSHENVETVREVYARWGEGDFRASLDAVDPLLLFVIPSGFPDAGTYLGVDRLKEYTRGFLEPWSHITLEAEDVTDAGDSVVAAVRQHGVGIESGAETDFASGRSGPFGAGKMIRLENFRGRVDALEAAGLSE